MYTYLFPVSVARRLPDPVLKPSRERHVFICRACDLPKDMKMDPNVREQNPDKKVYKAVAKSLRNEHGGQPDTFHLKNKGITICATSVEKTDENNYKVHLTDGQGIVDGGHTYSIIQAAMKNGECPATQHVKVEILTGLDADLIHDIADGLNTSVQVQQKSLAEHSGAFNWIKEAMKGTEFEAHIAFRENQDKPYDIRDIVSALTLFNIVLYSNDASVQEFPIGAFTGKEKSLERYIKDAGSENTFPKLAPILCDILKLMETIASEAAELHTKHNGGKGGKLAFVDYRSTPNPAKQHQFVFLNKAGQYRLADGALFPTLGAFRYLVVRDSVTGNFAWDTPDGFAGVLRIWEEVAPELMMTLKDTSDHHNRNINAMAKHRPLWGSLYNAVKARVLQDRQAPR